MNKLSKDRLNRAAELVVGIDPGVNTGLAIWDRESKSFIEITTLPIHKAITKVEALSRGLKILVCVEDARKRKWFGKKGKESLQGAGSVKRDCKMWEDLLKDLGVDFLLIPPKNNKTKISAEYFRKLTGWDMRTNVHGRDAAMLVLGY